MDGLCHENTISLSELSTIPLFLRFDSVELWYSCDNQPIETTSKFVKSHLLPLKPALKDSSITRFLAGISQNDHSDFSNDQSKLLAYIRHQFLPIFDSSRCYNFIINFHSAENNSTSSLIASILEMNEIKHCSTFEIEIFNFELKRLPVEEISNWLERSTDVMENTVQIRKERFLNIRFYPLNIRMQNGREMFEHLKAVDFKSKLYSS